jgi:hypothetical protein
MFGNSG